MAPPELPDYEPRERYVGSKGWHYRLLAVILVAVILFALVWWS